MEKRFALFLFLSFLILMLNAVVMSRFAPRPDDGAAVAEQDDNADAIPDPAEAAETPAPGDTVADSELEAETDPPELTAPPLAEIDPPVPAPADADEELISLGSVDPSDPYRLAAIFSTRGATVQRVELSSERFRDSVDRSGYLGHLSPESVAEGGCRIRVLVAGTPAAKAGLRPADVIVKLDSVPIHTPADLEKALESTRPEQEIELTVERDGERKTHVAQLTRRPLEVVRPERDNLRAQKAEIPAEFQDPASFRMTLHQAGEKELSESLPELAGVNLLEGNWSVHRVGDFEVEFERELPDYRLRVLKRYRIEKVPAEQQSLVNYPGYHIDLDVEIHNLDAESDHEVAYRLFGPTGLPIEGWWYAAKIGASGMRDVAVHFEGAAADLIDCTSIASGKEDERLGQGRSLLLAGVDAVYFSSVLIPRKKDVSEVWFDETRAVRIGPQPDRRKDNMRLTNVTCQLTSKPVVLPPHESVKHSFRVFMGPKRPSLLTRYGVNPESDQQSLVALVDYGWFGWVARPMLGILHFFYSIVGNYGIAIVLLTVLVRGAMFPLSLKQTRNMQKMQELQPEIKRIADQHKGNMEKRTKAQQELFRKHNYNPMGGCLVMFVQLPVFIGLYRALMVDVELRQAPLLGQAVRWCSNLSAPDMLLDWSVLMPDYINSGDGIFALGPYLNVLPMVTVALFLWQQKMFMPPALDEQAAMQQKIMKYMMVVIGVMFYKVASGLCIYFIASSLWGVAERKLLPKTTPPVAQTPPAEKKRAASTPSTNGNSKSGRSQKRAKQKNKKR